ncbi:UNKNOWN [Stylonychia lemnae]|uniref:Uncharacterized protein n=1 Tax=Stylonychia lemnae TaxID=5949 RepID=A0A078AZV0_STYLE|nr:UNKNOWN [Stylonychia lemnae]|eukprot:CDW87759.1 UNKNOWN [Stylonychia lemnae]
MLNHGIDARLNHFRDKIQRLSSELTQLEQILLMSPGQRQQIVIECKSDLFDPSKPIKILKVEKFIDKIGNQEGIEMMLEQEQSIDQSLLFQNPNKTVCKDQILTQKDFQQEENRLITKMTLLHYSQELTRVDDYIGDKQLMMTCVTGNDQVYNNSSQQNLNGANYLDPSIVNNLQYDQNDKQLDLKDFLIDPSRLNYSNDTCSQLDDMEEELDFAESQNLINNRELDQSEVQFQSQQNKHQQNYEYFNNNGQRFINMRNMQEARQYFKEEQRFSQTTVNHQIQNSTVIYEDLADEVMGEGAGTETHRLLSSQDLMDCLEQSQTQF